MNTPSSETNDHSASNRTLEYDQQGDTDAGRRDAIDSPVDSIHTVVVYDGRNRYEMDVEHGRTLRAVLREHNLSPHGWLTRHLNCDGQGHCTACTVDVTEGGNQPDQWLDAFLKAQDLGRLSCQINVTEDMTIRV